MILILSALPAHAQSRKWLYKKAKAEGALVLYAGGPTAPWEAVAKNFSARYPGVHVKIAGGFSTELVKKIDAQAKARKPEADLALLQTLQEFVRWKHGGRLLEFKPQGWDKIDASFKDANAAFVAVQINAHPYAYNPNLVEQDDVPRTALDFLNSRFKGRSISCYPADDDATLYAFYSVIQKYGWDFMDSYMANQPRFIQGHLGVARSIASGESFVTFDTVAGISMDVRKQGQPQSIAFSVVDPLPIWPYMAAIFYSAPHPNAAKLFLDWYLSPEQQAETGTWSPRSDVPPPNGWKPILSYKVVNNYREFLTNRRLLARLRKRFAAYTGPVKNAGGVR